MQVLTEVCQPDMWCMYYGSGEGNGVIKGSGHQEYLK